MGGAAVSERENEIGLGEGRLRVVARQHAGDAGGPSDQRLDQLGGARVEVGARLVEQQELGPVEHRSADGEALKHPAGERGTGSSARRPISTASRSSSTLSRGTSCNLAW